MYEIHSSLPYVSCNWIFSCLTLFLMSLLLSFLYSFLLSFLFFLIAPALYTFGAYFTSSFFEAAAPAFLSAGGALPFFLYLAAATFISLNICDYIMVTSFFWKSYDCDALTMVETLRLGFAALTTISNSCVRSAHCSFSLFIYSVRLVSLYL